MTRPRIAIVHDWLTNLGGAERVVKVLLEIYPDADLYTSVYSNRRLNLFDDIKVHTSWLQNWPLAKRKHQLYPVLRRLAFESFDFSKYDLVISSTSAEAKGIITSERTPHISYINTPTRYYWSHYQDYYTNPGFGWLDGMVRWQMRRSISSSRQWDFAAAQRPDKLLANSGAVANRIDKYYQRPSQVVYPPVDIERFSKSTNRPSLAPERYVVVVSRLIPYKRVDLAVKAAQQSKIPLIVIGTGSELKKLQQIATPETQFLGELKDSEVVGYIQHAELLIFPGEEDFGITPVEAMAAGTPVIAYGSGGAVETVVHQETGYLVERQTVKDFSRAIDLALNQTWSQSKLLKQAEKFSEDTFKANIQSVVDGFHKLK